MLDASIQAILLEKSLSPTEKTLLMTLYTRMDRLGWARMGINELSIEVGVSTRTIRSCLDDLLKRGYVTRDKTSGGLRPYPHSADYGYDDEEDRFRMVISLQQATLLRKACAAQESELMVIHTAAGIRKDRAKQQSCIAEIDEYVDVMTKLDTFIKRNTVRNQAPPKPKKITKASNT